MKAQYLVSQKPTVYLGIFCILWITVLHYFNLMPFKSEAF